MEVPLTDDALTLTILREIRDEIRDTRVELGSRIDQTNSRLDQVSIDLGSRLDHVESAILGLAEQQSFVVRWLKAGTRRDRHMERDVIKLTGRVDAIEARLPDLED
ncbi:MAG: hypothetical protein DRJ42_16250 [Deltaproteobacteria bacterium]|nr:MAG: hypothetical protein DRJ42_16250 [Deltaproteobacteria bacterium]